MTPEEFIHLKPGDKLRYGDKEFHVYLIEKAVWPESGVEGTSKVLNNKFQSIRLGDKIVERLVLVSEPYPGDLDIKRGQEEEGALPVAAKHMIRIDLVISGIDPDSHGWEFMEQTIEEAIESYGGQVTEYNVVNQ